MKIETREAAGFLRAPGAYRAILLHGSDEGLIRHRGALLTKLIAGSLSDTFRVAELDRESWPLLADEMRAISMIGGRRVIRVRDATDAILDPLKAALKTKGDGLIILEAPDLGRGKLRPFMEGGKDIAALACYPEEGRALQETIRAILHQGGVAADGEAIGWLAEVLGGDRHLLAAELEKLALLASSDGRIDIDMARQCRGATAGATADSALLAAMQGDVVRADSETQCAIADGLAGVALIRMVIAHLHKLHQARLRMASGLSSAEALRAHRPPISYKAMGATLSGLALWSEEALLRALEEARQIEMACKQTGTRPELLVRRFVSAIARQSRLRIRSTS